MGSAGSGLIGQSPAIHALLRRIDRVAPTDATVLILGERGTGKELVAQALAAGSRRRSRPFVVVNCAALPTEMLAGELFGHERGAFTGATERRPGLLMAAAGGTVFLDEVGDLAPAGQAMLLRFLQEREVRPLGATASLGVDVRVIAATNRDLNGAIAAGAFRADLHDRLSEVTIRVAPLRERAEDVALLVEHFLAVHARRHGVPVPRVGASVLRAMAGYTWLGNVRELEKAVSRAVIFAESGWVRAEDLGVAEAAGDRGVRASGEGVGVAGTGAPAARSLFERDAAGLTSRQREIVEMAGLHGVLCRRDVAERFGISGEAARREFVLLVRLGLLRRAGEGRGSRYLVTQKEPQS